MMLEREEGGGGVCVSWEPERDRCVTQIYNVNGALSSDLDR